MDSSVLDTYYSETDVERLDRGAETPRQHSRATSPAPRSRANITNPSDLDMPSPLGIDSHRLSAMEDGAETPSRNLSYKAGADTITVAQDSRKLRSVSQNDLPTLNGHFSSPLRRRNGVRLPTLLTGALQRGDGPDGNPFGKRSHTVSPRSIHSAGPVLYTTYEQDIPQSPTYIGVKAPGIFPVPKNQKSLSLSNPAIVEASSSTSQVNRDEGTREDTAHPPPMDTENDISLHYARLMRTLDRDHRKALHLKDKELEKLRERLNEVDIVYRQELKSRDFVIEDLKRRLESLQATSETLVEQARNEVEDLWESRWQTQSSKLTERMKRMGEEAQKTIDRFMAEREAADGGDVTP